ncbi:MAG: SDR family NAD(P)-dependent oxidoreductase [Bdellovibrionia bacterium]
MSFYSGKTVLITGASSGIGEALALGLAGQGANLSLLARRTDRLQAVAKECEKRGVRAITLECDVTKDGDLERAVQATRDAFGKIDVVIANAGFGVAGSFTKLNVEDYRRQFETNVFGLLRTVYATIDDLKKSRGNLVLLGSVAGHVALPGSSPYSMSKFAVRALGNALVDEFKPMGVTVTLVSPGFVDSEIRKVDNEGSLHAQAHDPIPAWIRVPTPKAAREILKAAARGQSERIITGHGKVIVMINRFAPWIIELVKRQGIKARPEPKKA